MSCAAGNSAGWGGAGELELRILIGPRFTVELAPVTVVTRDQDEEVLLICEVSINTLSRMT